MTFTYTQDLTVPRDFVRFYSGDTVEASSLLSDEIIASLIATTGGQETAVIAALRHILTRMSQPDFRADWLQVDYAAARAGVRARLADAERQFGTDALAVESVNTYRADSATTTSPDFSDGRP